MSTTGSLRGAALVAHIIEQLRAEDEGEIERREVPSDVLARIDAMTFIGGPLLPPSIRAYLKQVAEFPTLAHEPRVPMLRPLLLVELIERELGEEWVDVYRCAQMDLPGKCYLLPGGSESRMFLYTGVADDTGEYPVFYVDVDDGAALGLTAPGFDVWLAKACELFEQETYADVPPQYRAAMKRHAELNFGGVMSREYH